MNKTAIIGGGAAGLFAACRLIQNNIKPTIFEKNELVGRKLGITGKGRCNLTNKTSNEEFINNLTKNPKFMYSSVSMCNCNDVMNLFENVFKVPLKTERGNRVFPQSDKATDIVLAMKNFIINNGGTIKQETVTDLIKNGENVITEIVTNKKSYKDFTYIILCTGGKSYPLTGSTGDGYIFAKKLGHNVTELIPSLSALVCKETYCKDMQGLSLKNISISVFDESNIKVYTDFGELLFTHFGLSGPIILSASTHTRNLPKSEYKLFIDLKPALSNEVLNQRLLNDFTKNKNKTISNVLHGLLPSKMIQPFLEMTGIDGNTQVNNITKTQRATILEYLKNMPFTVTDFRPINEAIVTSGGIPVNEINSKTMNSKIIKNLYFAGEIIDVDAYTGGFNLQIAFSTANASVQAISNLITKGE